MRGKMHRKLTREKRKQQGNIPRHCLYDEISIEVLEDIKNTKKRKLKRK